SLAGLMTSFESRISVMPPWTKASASETFWQQMPTAPAAICFSAMVEHLCVLLCGRRRMPLDRAKAAIAAIFRSRGSRSTSKAGVWIASTGSPIRAKGTEAVTGVSSAGHEFTEVAGNARQHSRAFGHLLPLGEDSENEGLAVRQLDISRIVTSIAGIDIA